MYLQASDSSEAQSWVTALDEIINHTKAKLQQVYLASAKSLLAELRTDAASTAASKASSPAKSFSHTSSAAEPVDEAFDLPAAPSRLPPARPDAPAISPRPTGLRRRSYLFQKMTTGHSNAPPQPPASPQDSDDLPTLPATLGPPPLPPDTGLLLSEDPNSSPSPPPSPTPPPSAETSAEGLPLPPPPTPENPQIKRTSVSNPSAGKGRVRSSRINSDKRRSIRISRNLRQRGVIVAEILKTEKNYLRDLQAAQQLWQKPMEDGSMHKNIKEADVITIFRNFSTIAELSSKFYTELEREIPASIQKETDQLKVDRVAWIVADLVLKYAPFMLLYISYTNHHDVAVNTLARLEKHAGCRKAILEPTMSNMGNAKGLGDSRGLSLESFLIMPVQRIAKYTLLLGKLSEFTNESRDDYMVVSAALEKIRVVARKIDSAVANINSRATIEDHQLLSARASRLIKGSNKATSAAGDGSDGAGASATCDDEGSLPPPPQYEDEDDLLTPKPDEDVANSSTVHVDHDGIRVERWKSGRTRRHKRNGTWVESMGMLQTTSYTDGTVVRKYPDGSRVQIDVDGTETSSCGDKSTITTKPDGTTILRKADGETVLTDPDGTTLTTKTNGLRITVYANGENCITYTDNRRVQINPDGTKLESFPDGKLIQTNPDGTEIIQSSDGSQTQTNPDGTIIEATPDGCTTTKKTNGNVICEFADGTVEFKFPDGSKQVKTPDGWTVYYPGKNSATGHVRRIHERGQHQIWDADTDTWMSL